MPLSFSPTSRALGRAGARPAIAALAAALAGCGGGVPLLHPAQPLTPGRSAFAAGMSERLLLGGGKEAVDAAQRGRPGSGLGEPRFTQAVLAAMTEGPALAPYAAARVGLPRSNEAGLSYSGNALRADARHAFSWAQSALSVGLGVTGRGFGQSALHAPELDLDRAKGVGVDVPLVFGLRSDADLISAWAGVRLSWDHWSGAVSLDAGERFDLSASRFGLGPIVGLAVGLPPLWVAAELEVDYAHVTGHLERASSYYDAQQALWSVRPAGALIAKF